MGYTAVPNEIAECQAKMSQSEIRVTLALLRLTLGYQVTCCKTNYSTLEAMTGMSRGGVSSGVSATAARGFFQRIGRSGWQFLVYSVDQNSLPSRLTDNHDSLFSRPKQSTSYTNPVYSVDQNTPVLKKKESIKENIYIPDNILNQELPIEAEPFPEYSILENEIISALSGIVKETFAIGFTDDAFKSAAAALIGMGVDSEGIYGFGDWWKKNGYYKGAPALKSLVQEFGNYLAGVETGNGHGDYTVYWSEVRQELSKNGKRSIRKWNGRIEPVLKRAGGYRKLCSMSLRDAELTFKAAFRD